MRIGARQLANVALALVLGLVATTWAVVGLAQIRPLQPAKTVRAHLASAGGALAGAEVTYLGVPVGRVKTVKLHPDNVEAVLSVRPRGPMAREMRADVRQKSALGEPYVDLAPASKTVTVGDPDGAVIPIERTTVPRPLSTLLGAADKLLSDVQPGDVGRVVHGFSGLVGHENDLRQLISGAAEISTVVARRHAEFGALISDTASLTAALDKHRNDLSSAIGGWARISDVLATHTNELVGILERGGRFGADASDALAKSRGDLDGVLAGLDVTFHNLASRPTKVNETVDLAPLMITAFGKTFDGGNFWLSAGGATPFFPGYQPRYGVPVYGTGLRLDRIFLPTIAQRIDVDLGGPAAVIRLLSPDEAAAAIDGGAPEVRRQSERERAELDRSEPSATP